MTGEDEETVLAVVKPKKPRHPKVGKPSKPAANGKVPLAFTPAERVAVAETVFEQMANGRTLAETAFDLGLHESTVRLWINADEELHKEYLRRKRVLGQALADRALTVAMGADSKTFQAARLKVETLRWLASKVNAEEFGDYTRQETTGEVTLKIQVVEERVTPRQTVGERPETMRISARAEIAEAIVEDMTSGTDPQSPVE